MRRPILLEHRQIAADHLGELAREPGAARVGRHCNDLLGQTEVAHVLRQHRQGRHVIDGNLEEALHLASVQVHGEHTVGARRLDHVRHELCGDPLPWP